MFRNIKCATKSFALLGRYQASALWFSLRKGKTKQLKIILSCVLDYSENLRIAWQKGILSTKYSWTGNNFPVNVKISEHFLILIETKS